MPNVSAVQWAALHHFSPQYARRRLKELGAVRDADGKFSYEQIEALHAGKALPAAVESAKGDAAASAETRLTKAEGERRLVQARAERAEMENRLRAGLLVEASDIKSILGAMISAARQRLLAIGHRLAPTLALEVDALSCQAMIDEEVNSALQELCEWQPQK